MFFNIVAKVGSTGTINMPILRPNHDYILMPCRNPKVSEYVAAIKTPEEIEVIRGVEIKRGEWIPRPKTRDELMTIGVEFQGVMCSLHAEDQWGLFSIREDVLAGIPINYHFKNGNKLLLTLENAAAFEAVWKPARAAFFPVEE